MDQVAIESNDRIWHQGIVRTAFAAAADAAPLARLHAALGGDARGFELIILFVTPEAEAAPLIAEAKRVFAPARVIGCTTAGELTDTGYREGGIVAIALPRSHFRAETLLVPDLSHLDAQALIDRMIQNRSAMAQDAPGWEHEFTFLMIDGLSTREDALTAELAVGLGPVPLFGGSAGDGTRFARTRILHDGRAHDHAAILTQVRSRCPVRVFKSDHLVPTEKRMVVTGADPARRIVHEINAEPAAREYARILGKDPEQLTPFTFAAHPLVVQIGGQHHVRAIRQVAGNGDLVFFSAIDEGLVLTLAEPRPMVAHLREEMATLAAPGPPDIILGCDCILRRLEAQEKQVTGALSRLLSANRVIGFSTYGEQLNSMHVNHTLTGVAIYPPDPEAPQEAAP
ncbi:FIST N domain protein [Roseovarius sp. A-2]|uniref:FIST N-terminal domain-containing protein n=1 Tax=Roseovarius sp. A-2 TaxID=1570360 RepID=UPI0009B4FF9F|nr:FIST N-terminal domain-containing protein [Roseovarius sp. A-2]GAW33974.1 FIST N domain protein [Roseovarius sp. A-2]